ncbi:DUF4468 domain-containing protein [Pedobacter polysacchareus]|uniref:DUF4468 domain-containing protein n=1 Tax=Pedobacter polysacchareus TaxID=2861973 RepID=UPI002103FB9E|nr:DUF4468 domain-containing protein [Pedobacter polysacchareus]
MKLAVIGVLSFVGMTGVFAQELKEKQKSDQKEIYTPKNTKKEQLAAPAKTEEELPLDDRGKYIYYEVVIRKGKTKEELIQLAKAYFKSDSGPKVNLLEKDSLYTGKGKLIINKTAFVLTRPSGEVRYQLYLDFKEGKYRFWLTDFNFIPYQRDRYGNFVPATSIGLPLERKPGKLNASEWTAYLRATTKEAQEFAAQLKQGMLADTAIIQPAAKEIPVQSTKNQKW